MSDLWTTLQSLAGNLGRLLWDVVFLLAAWAAVVFWIMWATFGIDWRRLGPYLRQGAAIPLVMVAIAVALTCAAIYPRDLTLFGVTIPNYLWQVGAAALFLGVTLFCGWLQVRSGWFPPEIALDAPGGHHGHGDHDPHDHGHDAHHAHLQEPEYAGEDVTHEPSQDTGPHGPAHH